MTTPRFDLTPFLDMDEGQHFERKSLYEGLEGSKRSRDRRTVRDQVAEYVAAFANAEGGVLVLGIEDDGSVTGHSLPSKALATLLSTPRARLQPVQPEGFVAQVHGQEVLVFDVPASDVPVQVIGDGFPMRMSAKTVQASESQINALKFRSLAESWEARPSPLTLEHLDTDLLTRARAGSGYVGLTDVEYLLKRKLADRRGSGIVLRRSAELLFAKDGPDHPNASVRVFRVIGTERRFGHEHNVEERPRIEGSIVHVAEEAVALIGSLLRRPSRLVGNRFREVPEYPEFSWKEALLNAIAHRDYAVEGTTTEVWLFEDRMEVVSPGGLMPSLTLDELLSLQRVHASRNPRLVRALVDLGLVRDQGEGIPRMFAEMEGLFLPQPTITSSKRAFSVVLSNTPTFSAADRAFVASIGSAELTDLEFRALLEAHRHKRVDNARMRRIAGLDTLEASRMLGGLRDRDLLELHAAGAASYYTLGRAIPSTRPVAESEASYSAHGTDRDQLSEDRRELDTDRDQLDADRDQLRSVRGQLGVGRSELGLGSLPAALRDEVEALGTRPRKERLWPVIHSLCSLQPLRSSEIASLLGFKRPKLLVNRHLKPMCDQGQLERTHPDTPNHPDQAYRATTQGEDE